MNYVVYEIRLCAGKITVHMCIYYQSFTRIKNNIYDSILLGNDAVLYLERLLLVLTRFSFMKMGKLRIFQTQNSPFD